NPSPGQLDPTFGTGGSVIIPFDLNGGNYDQATSVLIQPDGKLLVGGQAVAGASGVSQDMELVRLNPNGSFDTSFGNSGVVRIAFDLGGTNQDEIAAMSLL